MPSVSASMRRINSSKSRTAASALSGNWPPAMSLRDMRACARPERNCARSLSGASNGPSQRSIAWLRVFSASTNSDRAPGLPGSAAMASKALRTASSSAGVGFKTPTTVSTAADTGAIAQADPSQTTGKAATRSRRLARCGPYAGTSALGRRAGWRSPYDHHLLVLVAPSSADPALPYICMCCENPSITARLRVHKHRWTCNKVITLAAMQSSAKAVQGNGGRRTKDDGVL
mmetsp:Transcript_27045/g.75428  ORF Transcript_27045/g.75428 Transcript_27045/m.75428 type:complete len:231 (-) Transcript_27045:124-816(-)